jgi:hypothetical protein
MLFQSYTGCRPAELVHAPRGKGLQDPLDEDTYDAKLHLNTDEAAYDDESDNGDDDDDSGYNSATDGGGRDILDDVMAGTRSGPRLILIMLRERRGVASAPPIVQ